MNQVKTIGVLTSWRRCARYECGDSCSGPRRYWQRDGGVLGIFRRGYNGLINGDMIEMNLRSVSDILQKGGTILYTARCLEFKEEAGIEKAKQTCVGKTRA